MELLRAMELLTVLVTLLMIMSGIPPCINMYKTGSTKNVPFPIFLLSLISGIGMLHYGLLIESGSLIFLNSIGVFLQAMYVTVYICITDNKVKYLGYLAAGGMYLVAIYSYIFSGVLLAHEATQLIGSASSTIVTVLVTLPALEIVNNIRFKNADGMPSVMLLGGLASGLCWLIFGLMLQDPNVYLPNIPGLTVTVAKLGMVFLYGGEKAKTE